MRLDQRSNHSEAKTRAAGGAVTRRFETIERLEHGLTRFHRDSRAFIIDR